jgi:hypothetical protein
VKRRNRLVREQQVLACAGAHREVYGLCQENGQEKSKKIKIKSTNELAKKISNRWLVR